MNAPTKTVYTVGEKVDYSGAKFHYDAEYEAGSKHMHGGKEHDLTDISDTIFREEYVLTPTVDCSETFVAVIDRSAVDTSKAGVYKVTAKLTNKDGSKIYSTASFEITVKAAQESYKLGDVNNDGLIDSVDASNILAEYARVSSNKPSNFSSAQFKAADVDGDNMVDSSDASRILAYYAYTSSGSGTKMSLAEFVGKK
jgi:hypothetical protein